MTGWLPPDVELWGGRPVARSAGELRHRCRAHLEGTVVATRTRRDPGPAFDATLEDGHGRLTLRWLGRDVVPGVVVGARLAAEGTVGVSHGLAVLVNPLYRFLPPEDP